MSVATTTPDDPDRVAALTSDIAEHAAGSDGLRQRAELCRQALRRPGGLHYIAHFGLGTLDFDADVLSHVQPGGADGTEDVQAHREACRKIARQLSFQSRRLNDWVYDAQSGALIRTVLQASGGALYCDRIVPGVMLVGATVGLGPELPHQELPKVPEVRAADEQLAGLVREMRQRIRLQSENLGAWDSPELRTSLYTDDDPTAGPEYQEPDPAGPAVPAVEPVVEGDPDHRLLGTCRAVVDVPGLHYVAFFEGGAQAFSIDVLHDRRLDEFHAPLITPAARRRCYRKVGAEFPAYVSELSRAARKAIGGPLERMVLDVEQGAIYYYRVGRNNYLVAATLYQNRVAEADDLIAEIALSCRIE